MALRPEVAARVAEISGKSAERVDEKLSINKEWIMEKLIETVKRALQERPVLDSRGKRLASTVTLGLPLIGLVSCLAKSLVCLFLGRKVGAPGEFDDIWKMNADELRAFIQRALANSGTLN
jgi:hypothetical protein